MPGRRRLKLHVPITPLYQNKLLAAFYIPERQMAAKQV
jgi:hypothetical protein